MIGPFHNKTLISAGMFVRPLCYFRVLRVDVGVLVTGHAPPRRRRPSVFFACGIRRAKRRFANLIEVGKTGESENQRKHTGNRQPATGHPGLKSG